METAILRVVLGLTGLFILWVRETDAWKLYKRITKWQRRALLEKTQSIVTIAMLPDQTKKGRMEK
jgi:hypothetical protein